MEDIVDKRSTALNRLLEEFDRPPPVPPKDDRRHPYLTSSGPEDLRLRPASQDDTERHMDRASHKKKEDPATNAAAAKGARHTETEHTVSRAENIKTQTVTAKRKKVAFVLDDILSPPPVSLDKESFKDELAPFELNTSSSVFDPPPAPRLSRFPTQLPEAPKRKPAPLNLNRPTSQTGKWKVRAAVVEPDIWTPIDDEPDTASMISMEVRNAPRICPLPYKPVKSVPLRSRGSLRPAPLRIRKGVRFDSAKSPAYLPLKSPALLVKKVRFDNVKSPAASRFKTPATPYSSSTFTVLSPGRKNGVRFASIKSPAASKFKTPSTPYYQSRFRVSVSSASKRNVRFDSVKSPATSRFKIPPTPFYEDTFEPSMPKQGVRFADFKSPAASKFSVPPTPFYEDTFESSSPEKEVRFEAIMSPATSSFKSPPTPYHQANFRESMSPPDHSPVTPRAMHMVIPDIRPDSPSWSPELTRSNHAVLPERPVYKLDRNDSEDRKVETIFPPRTTSLQHKRNVSLPKDLNAQVDSETTLLPATTFDENAVGESTLRWLGMLPKPSYRISNENNLSDRSQILGSYFHKSRPSM